MELERQVGGLFYNIAPSKMISTVDITIIIWVWGRKEDYRRNQYNNLLAKEIGKSIKRMLERLWRGIFKLRVRIVTRHGATTQKHMEIQDSNDENNGKGDGA